MLQWMLVILSFRFKKGSVVCYTMTRKINRMEKGYMYVEIRIPKDSHLEDAQFSIELERSSSK